MMCRVGSYCWALSDYGCMLFIFGELEPASLLAASTVHLPQCYLVVVRPA